MKGIPTMLCRRFSVPRPYYTVESNIEPTCNMQGVFHDLTMKLHHRCNGRGHNFVRSGSPTAHVPQNMLYRMPRLTPEGDIIHYRGGTMPLEGGSAFFKGRCHAFVRWAAIELT